MPDSLSALARDFIKATPAQKLGKTVRAIEMATILTSYVCFSAGAGAAFFEKVQNPQATYNGGTMSDAFYDLSQKESETPKKAALFLAAVGARASETLFTPAPKTILGRSRAELTY